MDIYCSSCRKSQFFLRKKGSTHVGAYCMCNGKWLKWIGKKEIRQYVIKGMPVLEEWEQPPLMNQPPPVTVPTPSSPVEEEGFPTLMDYGVDPKALQEVPSTPTEEVTPTKPSTTPPVACTTCETHVLEPLCSEDKYVLGIQGNVVLVRNREFTEMVASFQWNYCPTCGQPLNA